MPKVMEALRSVRVCAVAAGDNHSLVLDVGGEVNSFGAGGSGRLGHGDTASQPTPQVIKALKGVRVCAVAAGEMHSLVVGSAGEV
jgi:regulator of chromosome condensation